MTAEPRKPARAVTDGETVLATMDIEMLPDQVFRAFNTKEVERWWGSPDTYRMTEWSADLRVGGRWHVVVRSANGQANPAGGKFLEIDEPRKIVFTRKYEWDFPQLGQRETTVTYLCEPIAIGTRITVRHEGFAGLRASADNHAEGWERVLGWLDASTGPDRISAIVAAFRADLKDPNKPFALLAQFKVKDGTQETFEAAFAEATVPTRREKGVIAYQLHREAKDETRFVVYERWKSLADLEAHLRTPYITTLIAVTDEVLAGAPEFRVLRPTAE